MNMNRVIESKKEINSKIEMEKKHATEATQELHNTQLTINANILLKDKTLVRKLYRQPYQTVNH